MQVLSGSFPQQLDTFRNSVGVDAVVREVFADRGFRQQAFEEGGPIRTAGVAVRLAPWRRIVAASPRHSSSKLFSDEGVAAQGSAAGAEMDWIDPAECGND